MTASSPNFGATGYWPISAIPGRTRTMPSEPCGPGSRSLPLLRRSRRAAEPLAVRIGIATGMVVVGDLIGEGACWSRLWSARRRTLPRAFKRWPSPEPSSSPPHAPAHWRSVRSPRSRPARVQGFRRAGRGLAGRGRAASESRFEAVHLTGLTDLIGREDEIGFLLERRRLARKGEGQVVLLSGEPGIGKSRLAAALAERLAGEPHTRLRYHARPITPTAHFVRSLPSWSERRGSRQTIRPSNGSTSSKRCSPWSAPRIEAVAPLFAALLSIPSGERYPPLELSPTQQRRRTFAALLDQLEGLRTPAAGPALVRGCALGDATSFELLDWLSSGCASYRSLHCSPSGRSSSRPGLVCRMSAP